MTEPNVPTKRTGHRVVRIAPHQNIRDYFNRVLIDLPMAVTIAEAGRFGTTIPSKILLAAMCLQFKINRYKFKSS